MDELFLLGDRKQGVVLEIPRALVSLFGAVAGSGSGSETGDWIAIDLNQAQQRPCHHSSPRKSAGFLVTAHGAPENAHRK
jgi:hypothetical protein